MQDSELWLRGDNSALAKTVYRAESLLDHFNERLFLRLSSLLRTMKSVGCAFLIATQVIAASSVRADSISASPTPISVPPSLYW